MAANPLNDIYTSVFTLLRSGITTIKWLDIDIGQLDEPTLPMKYPAVLLKFEDVIWRKKSATVQEGLVNVSVKIVFKFSKESEMYAPENTRVEVQNFIKEVFTIHDGIITLSGTTFSRLVRFNQYQMKTSPKDLLWAHEIQYQCNIQSDAAIEDPTVLNVDYDNVKNNNAFMERKRFNLIHK